MGHTIYKETNTKNMVNKCGVQIAFQVAIYSIRGVRYRS